MTSDPDIVIIKLGHNDVNELMNGEKFTKQTYISDYSDLIKTIQNLPSAP